MGDVLSAMFAKFAQFDLVLRFRGFVAVIVGALARGTDKLDHCFLFCCHNFFLLD